MPGHYYYEVDLNVEAIDVLVAIRIFLEDFFDLT